LPARGICTSTGPGCTARWRSRRRRTDAQSRRSRTAQRRTTTTAARSRTVARRRPRGKRTRRLRRRILAAMPIPLYRIKRLGSACLLIPLRLQFLCLGQPTSYLN
jgi:hypothetical protein